MTELSIILTSAALGAVGGMARGLVGLFKALAVKMKIRFWYWFLTICVSAIIGIMTGIIFGFDYRLSILAGYAGLDVLEGIYKSFAVQKIYSPPSRK